MRTDDQPQALAEVVIELSWEVCNKVGGIYTVIQSKAPFMRQFYDEYFTVGPYFKDRADYEFEEEVPPEEIAAVLERLKDEGITCYYGMWRIKGEPKAILVDYRGISHRKDEFKAWFWEHYKVDSLKSGWDFEEPVVWSWACARLLQELMSGPWLDKKVVSHHHEWMAGLSLLYAKQYIPGIRTVFTTHATMLGRSVAGHGEDLYGMLDELNPDEKAQAIGVHDKFSVEKACAQAVDVFTTVSEITGMEAERLLGRKPEVLVFNGFDLDRFPTIEETSLKHTTSKELLHEFQTYFFFPYYHNFSLEKNTMMCISGRYEFGNKGMDVFVDALGRLNEELKKQRSEKTVTVFFWVLRLNAGVRHDVLENKGYYRHIKNYVRQHSEKILNEVTRDFIIEENPAQDAFYTKEFLFEMKKDVLHFKRKGNPPVSTHNVPDDADDPLLQRLVEVGLDNKNDDKVKVVVYPCFLDGNDAITDLPYYEALAGTHLAIFPSAYEPWGYTPLEAAAMGVPTITTDLAGFGRFIKPNLSEEQPGVFVIDRFKKPYLDVVQGLYDALYHFVMELSHEERVQNKIHAKELSRLADWQELIKHYVEAHNMALEDMPNLQ
ncbi:glycogen/starch synthase [Candidatus Woesearchaeota archaeon]|nr:glycogen/starch synthase [Candidatus Woesearchaeota archaeon]